MNRAQFIKLINVGRNRLGWDDDTYRPVLQRFGGQPDEAGRVSLNSLCVEQMAAVLEYMRSAGFTAKPAGRPHNADTAQRAEMIKIEALLADASRPWAYARSLARHMYKKDRLEFCSVRELVGIVTALEKAALKRLSGELLAIYGEDWEHIAGHIAYALFGFNASKCRLAAYSQHMSQVVRWWRGELQVACEWPVDLQRPVCCGYCYQQALRKADQL